MSLYSHIAAKEDLVALMLNEVSGRGLVARASVRQLARGHAPRSPARPTRCSWTTHGRNGAFGTGTRVAGPNLCAGPSSRRQAVEGLGPRARRRLDRAAGSCTSGPWATRCTPSRCARTTSSRTRCEKADPEEFPLTSGVIQASKGQPADEVFETALAVALDGIATHFDLP